MAATKFNSPKLLYIQSQKQEIATHSFDPFFL